MFNLDSFLLGMFIIVTPLLFGALVGRLYRLYLTTPKTEEPVEGTE